MIKGYKKKPVLIEFFSLLYLLNPIGNFFFTWYFASKKYSPSKVLEILMSMIANGNVLVIINISMWLLAIPLAYGLFRVRLWAWFYFIIHSVGMFVLSFFNMDGFHPTSATIINFFFLIPIGYFISKEIRTPYFNPRVRWWTQPKRLQHTINIKMGNKEYNTFDISEEGAFLVFDKPPNVEIGHVKPIEILLDKDFIHCDCEVRWVNNEAGHYPLGCGIKFSGLTSRDRSRVRNFIDMLVESGKQETH